MKFFVTPRQVEELGADAARSNEAVRQRPSARTKRALMPVLENANEREFRDGAALAALSRTGGPLTDAERGHVLEAVETLRRDDAEILRFAKLAEAAMHQLGITVRDYRILPGSVSSLQDPQRVIIELENSPMAHQCVDELKRSLQLVR